MIRKAPLLAGLLLPLLLAPLFSGCTTAPDDGVPDESRHSLSGRVFTDAGLGYSLTLPASWTTLLDQTAGRARLDVQSKGAVVDNVYPNINVIRAARNAGQSLTARMVQEAGNLEASVANGDVTGSRISLRGSDSIAEIFFTQTSQGVNFKQKLTLFYRRNTVVALTFTAAASDFDSNADLQAIDSSLTFF